MKIKSGFIVRKVGDENIVVPVGENSKTFHGMIKLNESGCFLWNFFTEEHTKQDAVAALVDTYEGVDEQLAARDVDAFVAVLEKYSFLA